MKLIITDTDEGFSVNADRDDVKAIAVDVEKAGEHLELRTVQEIRDKMRAIANNLETIKEVALENAENSTATLDGKPKKEQEYLEALEILKVKRVELVLDWAHDEFNLLYKKGSFLPNSCFSIEVVTAEVAKENDMDWIDNDTEISLKERKTYKLGEVLSDYRKLGKSGYYFKFM